MKAVIGLGNPGAEYEQTRHNAGFAVLDALRDLEPGKWEAPRVKQYTLSQVRIKCEIAEPKDADGLLLVKPLTFMNRSGDGVTAAAKAYGFTTADVLIVCDDVNLPLGQLRLRTSGSSGGQKGLESVIQAAGTPDIARLRLGVSGEVQHKDLSEYVLSPFEERECTAAEAMFKRGAEAILCWFESGMEPAMNRFNALSG